MVSHVLATISRNIVFRTINEMPDQTVKAISKGHGQCLWCTQWCRVSRPLCPLWFGVQTHFWSHQICSRGLHELCSRWWACSGGWTQQPDNQRTLFRTMFQAVPFWVMPHIMNKHLAYSVVAGLNMAPPSGGILPWCTPHVIIKQTQADYKKHFSYLWTMCPCTGEQSPIKCTQIPSIRNAFICTASVGLPTRCSSGHESCHWQSALVWHHLQSLPITCHVINTVERLGLKEGHHSVKIQNRHGVHPLWLSLDCRRGLWIRWRQWRRFQLWIQLWLWKWWTFGVTPKKMIAAQAPTTSEGIGSSETDSVDKEELAEIWMKQEIIPTPSQGQHPQVPDTSHHKKNLSLRQWKKTVHH